MQKMKIEIKELEKPDRDWDKRVLNNDGTIYQTTVYARFQEECLGMKSLYIVAKQDSKLVGQLMVNYGPRFAKYLRRRSKRIYNLFSKYLKIYTFIRGPIIIDEKLKKEAYKALVSYLDERAKKDGFMIHDVSLPIEEDESLHNVFYKKGFYFDLWGTILIDLSKSEEVLWKEVSRSHRRSIRKGRKQGLVVKEAKTKKDYNKVISIIIDMARRNKIFAHSKEYYYTLFRILKEEKMGKVLFIEKNKKGIATITLYLFGKKVTQTLIAHTEYSVKHSIYGVDFLEWHIIKWGKDNGYKTYDLAGIRPESKDPKEAGLKYYKTKWGGRIIKYPYFSKKYSKLKFGLIDILINKGKRKLVTFWK